ncbi:MAG: TIGR04283 family arsenosugar biosynthesis glycosyltransferase [Pirellulaceae bacterium]
MDAKISVIIPALNEVGHLKNTLVAPGQAENVEIIVVDGGSCDGTDDLAVAAGVRLLRSPAGRARQMNLGAAAATGDIYLFLHADTQLSPGFEQSVRAALRETGVIAGAFRLHIDGPERSLRLIEWGTNWRSRWRQMPYGDQALFVRAETFRKLGGFKELPIMEDFEFVQRLRRAGRIAILPEAVTTSARRWHALGPWRTTWINQMIIGAYHLGISAERLSAWYSGVNVVSVANRGGDRQGAGTKARSLGRRH